MRLTAMVFFLALAGTPPALAMIPGEPGSPPAVQPGPAGAENPADSETLDYDHAFDTRMTLPVVVDGRGPYRFIIDTGAERTVISRELAETLQLAASEDVMLTSVFDVQQVPTVMVPELGVGRRTIDAIQAPALERRNLGAAGVLGIDALEDQHVLMDFERQEITVTNSRRFEDQPYDGVIVVRARTRLGRLVVADARIEGTRIFAIVDTGSTVSIGNSVLRERLLRRGRMNPEDVVEVTAVTGTTMRINYLVAEEVDIGNVTLNELPIAFVDSELFRELNLLDRPAMLLGINALRAFDRVSIDFANRELRLQFPSYDRRPTRNFAVALDSDQPASQTRAVSAWLSIGGEQR